MSTGSQKPGVGALMQLNLLGQQDEKFYELNKPVCNTFTNKSWKQSTRGATEQNEIPFPFVLGSTNKKVIPKRGDMMGNLLLAITLPVIPGAGINDYWLPRVGYILLKKMRLTLNDIELDSSERLWLSIHDDLFLPDGMTNGFNDMLGTSNLRLSQEHKIIVPLKFFNCYVPGQRQNFLPLLGSTRDTITLEIETETFQNCITSYSGINAPAELECELVTDYVFLDDLEKEQLVNRPYPVLAQIVQDVEQVSYREVLDSVTGDERIPTDTLLVDMSEINYPVKYICFVAYSVDAVERKEYFTYLDIIDRASLLFDNEERTEHQSKDIYSLVQTYRHAKRCISDKVYMYSFALDAFDSQPSGHFTFSNVRRVKLRVTLREKRDDVIVKCFVVGYRWIDFENGSARVRFI
jgi:hypothetical protein